MKRLCVIENMDRGPLSKLTDVQISDQTAEISTRNAIKLAPTSNCDACIMYLFIGYSCCYLITSQMTQLLTNSLTKQVQSVPP